MRFDSQGNLCLYEPGAGMSGEPRRVIEFGSEEVVYADGETIMCDLDDHETITEENLVYAMSRFIREITKLNGEQYPAKTLYEIMMCVQFHLESIGFMWRLLADNRFTDLKFCLDNVMKERASANIGSGVHQAKVLSPVDIDILWENGFLGSNNPRQLLRTVFFSIGMSCALRAGKEQQKLRSIPFKSQFRFTYDSAGREIILYTEDLAGKTNKGGLKHRKLDPKRVNVYAIPESNHCPFTIIKKYLSLLPAGRKCKSFYLQPRKKFIGSSWYQDRAVGVNKLQSIVRETCESAGFPGFFTNHSLRATAATRMYHNDIDEQIIQEVTGHRSVAVRQYKRTCDNQKLITSACIMGVNNVEPCVKRAKYSK